MGKFREFVLTEDIGLADLGPRLHNFYNSPWLDAKIGAALVPGNTSRGDGIDIPSTNLTIPSNERTGRIEVLMLKRNPIYVRLSDGTETYFSHDEYNRIEGTPELHKTMTVIFQRHPNDASKSNSKIDKAIVRD